MPPSGVLGRAFLLETPIDDPATTAAISPSCGACGLEEVAPPVEKGFSMLTSAIKKKSSRTKRSKEACEGRERKKKAKSKGKG